MSNQISAGVLIQRVQEGSIAQEVGLETGDRLLAINECLIEDTLDYQYVSSLYDQDFVLRVAKSSGEVWEIEIEKDEDEDIGIELEGIQTRICKNNCIFCFVHQLPRGKHIRRTLRVKDEDFRLSFLFGHYLTLTNLSEADFQRIFEQRLSPLYVSVHATEPHLRQYLLQSRKPDDLLGNMRRLIEGGVKLHTQIVLIPGVNDGAHLERSLRDLLEFYPNVMSVSIVPVGLTDHRKGLPQLSPVDALYAKQTIEHVQRLQQQHMEKVGAPFCFLGDEFYLMAGHPIPMRSHYGDFPLVENGVGMVRNFLDEFALAMRKRWTCADTRSIRGTVVTGSIFYPILRKSVEQINARFRTDLKCLAVENRFFGRGITVAGLLSGSDIFQAVQHALYGEFLVVPSEAMTGEKGLFLDDWLREDLELRIQLPVLAGGYHVTEFFHLVFREIPALRGRPSSLPSDCRTPSKFPLL
jgi:putative radical SAM enzyme (TIGR03279 family)